MEKERGLLKAEVVNQSLPSEEEMEEASRRSALEISDPKETTHAESYEGPSRVSLEEVVAEKQPEVAEEKKKKNKIKEKRAEGDEEAHPIKTKKKIKEKRVEGDEEAHPIKKKERRAGEKRECRQKKKRLRKEEEKRKRAESPKIDGESTSVRVDKGESAQLREST
ncbi:nucleolar protein 58-like [Benincasa hispida]|uniref:nucleolar protein 58-like n=1 Tax=Benincasa hispida TaxID=102211 RepID=UPI001902A3F2|nr:nucleolar protein 58-like [Benincasa hispida]